MKITCGLTLIIVLLAVVNNVQTSEYHDRYEKLILKHLEACKETNPSERDIKEMRDGVLPSTRTAKCFNACFMNKMGVMNEEKIVPDQYARFITEDILQLKGSEGETLRQTMKEIAEECVTVSDPDKCDSVFKISVCISAAAKKRGFN